MGPLWSAKLSNVLKLKPFHLAISVNDLGAARRFYRDVLGCAEGRSAENWIDFDFYGHQLVCHAAVTQSKGTSPTNLVDGEQVPVPHFGVVLGWDDWEVLAERLQSAAIDFLIEPTVRFAGQPGEQATMFLADPAGNMLEFKAMRNPENLFKT